MSFIVLFGGAYFEVSQSLGNVHKYTVDYHESKNPHLISLTASHVNKKKKKMIELRLQTLHRCAVSNIFLFSLFNKKRPSTG